jgi:hypothetical protein
MMHICIYACIHTHIHIYIYGLYIGCVYLSIDWSIFWSTDLSSRRSIDLSVCWSFDLSIYRSIFMCFLYIIHVLIYLFFLNAFLISLYGLQLYLEPRHKRLPGECKPYLWTTFKIEIPHASMRLRMRSTRHQDVGRRNHSSTKHHPKKYMVWYVSKFKILQKVLNFGPTPVMTHHLSRTYYIHTCKVVVQWVKSFGCYTPMQ